MTEISRLNKQKFRELLKNLSMVREKGLGLDRLNKENNILNSCMHWRYSSKICRTINPLNSINITQLVVHAI